MSNITSTPSGVGGGSMALISTQTASSSSTISFTTGIDSTYKEYILKYINVHPSSDGQNFQVNFRDGSTAYDATKTTTVINVSHAEDESAGELQYKTSNDLAQSTNFQNLAESLGADNDQCASGQLHLFDPSNTTFVKTFMSQTQNADSGNNTLSFFVAGYINTTAAIDGVQFKMSSGNIDSGVFKLYGIS
tara:strand:+ start:845 stop:1417 length:573 start_codon:yes stop_codon:yes gene_type:complete